MTSFAASNIRKLQQAVGPNLTLIVPAVRAVITDQDKGILLIRRSDNGTWALPAGGMELEESAWDCLLREVREETGLHVLAATPIALYSEPRFTFVNAFGNRRQMFALVFQVDTYQGDLIRETEETVDARFFPFDALPPLLVHHIETIQDWRSYDGRFILK